MKDFSKPLEIIRLLADSKYHSGEKLGKKFGMTRVAINKHIRTLVSMGLDFETTTGKGYRLRSPIKLLDSNFIRNHLPNSNVHVLNIIDSTNQYILDNMGTLSSGDVCISEYQFAGRGRRGNKWHSPFGQNLYLSMYWRLEQGLGATMGLSLVVAIILAETLEQLGAKNIKVKWPNDIYLKDKKLAGILVEVQGKTGDVAHVILGVGINLMMDNLANDYINQKWISLKKAGISLDRNTLSIELTKNLIDGLKYFEKKGLSPFMERWVKYDNFLNRRIKLLFGNKEIFGISRGIDNQGGLLLDQQGKITSYTSGEISVRKADIRNFLNQEKK